jgi:hypothetical protein
MALEHRIYVYGAQRNSAKALLDQCGMATERHRIQVVNSPERLAGLAYGTFLVVTGHPAPVPAEIMHAVYLCGLVVFHLDDVYARAKAARRAA